MTLMWERKPATLADRLRDTYGTDRHIRYAAADALDAQEARIKRLEEALRECADDLEGEIDGRYKGTLNYPSQLRRYERDMETVNRAREALKP